MPVFDNFSNSQPEALARAERITGRKPALIQGGIRDLAALLAAFRQSGATSVIYFACLKAVSGSAQSPLACYDNNVVGTVTLLEAMTQCGVKTLAFNSSATVFGDPQRLPLCEYHPLSATNPYGQTRLPIENMLRDQYRSDPSWRIGVPRYFNPVGAHESSLIGEDLQSMVRASEQPSGKLVHYQVVPVALEISPRATLTRLRLWGCRAGAHSAGSKPCARTPGAGKAPIPADTLKPESQ